MRTIQIKDQNKVLYECKGVWRGNLLYFLAEYTHNKPVTMVLLDEQDRIIYAEPLPNVKGKFGPGAINHSLFKKEAE